MLIFYTLLRHISGLALIFFIVSLILVITDLENITTVATQVWLTKLVLITGFLLINKWCVRKVTDLKSIQQS